MLDGGLRDIINIQVQYVAYAVHRAVCRLLGLGVLTADGIGLAVVSPDIGLARTNGYCLYILVHFLIDVRSDDTIAP